MPDTGVCGWLHPGFLVLSMQRSAELEPSLTRTANPANRTAGTASVGSGAAGMDAMPTEPIGPGPADPDIDIAALQTRLAEAEQLAHLAEMVPGIAHDVNTPIGVAVTAATHLAERTRSMTARFRDGTLKRSDFASYAEMAEDTTDLLLSNLERAAELIQALKQLAVDQGSRRRRRFDLRSYVGDCIRSLAPQIRRGTVTVEVDVPPDIEMDSLPGALSQVVTNLVMNALIHAFPDDARGTVRLHAEQPNSDTVRLTVQDDGRGMPGPVCDRVFERFYTTRAGQGGSGLGLSMVHALVSGPLGGAVSVDSTPGVGTTFTIDLPKVAPPSGDGGA